MTIVLLISMAASAQVWVPEPLSLEAMPLALPSASMESGLSSEALSSAVSDLPALSSLEGLASAAEDEFPGASQGLGAALPAPPSREVLPSVSAAEEAERDTLSHFEKVYLVLKHYLRGRKYSMALRALSFARKHHVGTRRDGVTPEFEHQLSIALYLTTLKDVADEEKAVTAALLHDVMEDYDVSREEIAAEFGEEMAGIVTLLTKEFRGVKKDTRAYFDDIAKDPVASLVKGADRIHNVQSMIGVFSLEKQKEYIAEVETYFMPMLKRAGANFPEQTAAYYNIRQMLKSQLQLLKAHHRTLEGLK